MDAPLTLETHDDWTRGEYAFCPKCGGSFERKVLKPSEPLRHVCRACGFVFFLDPKVAVGTIITVQDRILLLKRGIEPGYGKWVFPGGFVDRGEPVEDAAIREAKEEIQLDVRIARLLNVYSYQNHPVIIIVYLAEAIGGEPGVGDETIDVRAFESHAIPWQDLAFPSTGQALRDYLRGREVGLWPVPVVIPTRGQPIPFHSASTAPLPPSEERASHATLAGHSERPQPGKAGSPMD